jgi:dihydroxyacetone synthase
MAPIAIDATSQMDGDSQYGLGAAKGMLMQQNKEAKAVLKLSHEQELTLRTIRLLIADLCQQFNGGHPGYVKCSRGVKNDIID